MDPLSSRYREVPNPASCLPVSPRLPAHMQERSRQSRETADFLLMCIGSGATPVVGLADMRALRDLTGDRKMFDIELEERVGDVQVVKKFPVSQYVLATAYCLFLEGQKSHYAALAVYLKQLQRGDKPSGTYQALEALEAVTRNLPRIEPEPSSLNQADVLLRSLPTDTGGGGADAGDFRQPPPDAGDKRKHSRRT